MKNTERCALGVFFVETDPDGLAAARVRARMCRFFRLSKAKERLREENWEPRASPAAEALHVAPVHGVAAGGRRFPGYLVVVVLVDGQHEGVVLVLVLGGRLRFGRRW